MDTRSREYQQEVEAFYRDHPADVSGPDAVGIIGSISADCADPTCRLELYVGRADSSHDDRPWLRAMGCSDSCSEHRCENCEVVPLAPHADGWEAAAKSAAYDLYHLGTWDLQLQE